MAKCTACDFDPSLPVLATYTLVLEQSAQSLNAVGTNAKTNRGYRAARNRWARLLKQYKHLPKATGHRRIYFTRFWKKRKYAYDYGNLVGGFKPLLDEIVKAGLLLDDKPSVCSDYYRQFKSPDGFDRVVVVIEEV